MARVADLLGDWARERGESETEVRRWTAAGHLHDALREERHEVLRTVVDDAFRDLPGKILHGPGAAARLRGEGVRDEEFLEAISFHTLGSPSFGPLGKALYAADFLEPGRKIRPRWRARLRSQAALHLDEVVKEILSIRIQYLVGRGRPLQTDTVAFWNQFAEGQAWAAASES
jgi:HD superfamily phosphohydrolase YqeK